MYYYALLLKRRFSYIAFVSFFSFAQVAAHRDSYTLTPAQTKSYIQQNIAAFESALGAYLNASSARELRQSIWDCVTATPSVSQWVWQDFGWLYSKDRIDEGVSSGILHFIEITSYRYAFLRTKNKTISEKIAESMRNNAHALIQQSSYLNPEMLVPFVGKNLERAVNDALNRFDAPHQSYEQSYQYGSPVTPIPKPAPQQQTYLSEECCSCTEFFDHSSHRRIILSCGHDICALCACNWFIDRQNRTCPQCRATINMEKLQQDLAR